MKDIYETIKKKRNLRRISTVWLFLLAVELFCPALCNDSPYAAETNSSISASVSIVSDDSRRERCDDSVSSRDRSSDNPHETICNDECLCHATAIPGVDTVPFTPIKTAAERIAFQYGDPLFNSLPPPFQPPKRS